MLFCLRSCVDGSLFYLLKDKQYSVGRKECDILITNDHSVSRKHAEIKVLFDKVVLQDCGSRYKTFVDNLEIQAYVEVTVELGSTIRFGMLRSNYILEQIRVVTTTSSLQSEKKLALKGHVAFLGGTIVSNWNPQCTHVTIETEIMLTIKVLCAVIAGTPIVKLKFWEDCVDCVKRNLPLPGAAAYQPGCSEVILNYNNISLDYNKERLSLFKNKVFVFPTKEEKLKMLDMIKLAGGDAISWDCDRITKNDLHNSTKDYLLLQPLEQTGESVDESLQTILSYNAELRKRTIPLQEIALAIITNSCETNCNSNFDRRGTVLAMQWSADSQNSQVKQVLVQPTQTQESCHAETQNIKTEVIPPSVEDKLDIDITENKVMEETMEQSVVIDICSSLKREGDSIENETKRIKIESADNKFTWKKRESRSCDVNIEVKQTEKPIEKGLFVFKRDKPSISTETAVVNPFVKKRKAGPDQETPSKRTAFFSNTVAPSSSQSSTESAQKLLPNPFSNILKSKNSGPLATSTQQSKKVGSALSSTAIGENVSSLQLDISAIEPVNSQLEKSCKWFSKVNSPAKSTQRDCSTDSVDEQLQKYIESFKNTVVIKEEPLVAQRSISVDDSGDASVTDGHIKNFKKFKKVAPLKIQTKIIPQSSYVNVICNDKSAAAFPNNNEEESEDDDNELAFVQKKAGKRNGRGF